MAGNTIITFCADIDTAALLAAVPSGKRSRFINQAIQNSAKTGTTVALATQTRAESLWQIFGTAPFTVDGISRALGLSLSQAKRIAADLLASNMANRQPAKCGKAFLYGMIEPPEPSDIFSAFDQP